MAHKALFVGSTCWDMLMLVDAPPQSDQRIGGTRFETTLGGVATTAATAYQRLGSMAGLITAVGEDRIGENISAELEARGFAHLDIRRVPGAQSSLSMIQVEENGKRCISCYGGCIQRLTWEDLDLEAFRQAKVIHLGVLYPELTLGLARWCKEQTRALVSVDGGNMSKELTDAILPYADFFIPDHKTAMRTLGLQPREACAYYVEHGARFAAVTSGEGGTVGYDGQEWYQAPALPVKVLDTTGAGDNFHGAFLYTLDQDWTMNRRLAFANTFASLSCRGLGGSTALPTKEEVLAAVDKT